MLPSKRNDFIPEFRSEYWTKYHTYETSSACCSDKGIHFVTMWAYYNKDIKCDEQDNKYNTLSGFSKQ